MLYFVYLSEQYACMSTEDKEQNTCFLLFHLCSNPPSFLCISKPQAFPTNKVSTNKAFVLHGM